MPQLGEFSMYAIKGRSVQSSKMPIPDILYHYTDTHGFYGIMASNCLWASYFGHMNDGSEIQYGCDLFEQEYIAAQKAGKLENIHGHEVNLRHDLRRLINQYPPYLFCLCEERELLSQWRAYSGSSTSYCIGFRARDLNAIVGASGLLVRVEYSEVVQREMISHFLEDCCKYFEERKELLVTKQLIDEELKLMTKMAFTLVCGLKHPAFKVENEWRIVLQEHGSTNPEVNYRPHKMGVTPYKIIGSSDSERLPVRTVDIGPTESGDTVAAATFKFLRHHGFNVSPEVSSIPLRSL